MVPSLLQALEQGGEDGELAMLGLKEIVNTRPRDLLEYLLPKLLTHPIDVITVYLHLL